MEKDRFFGSPAINWQVAAVHHSPELPCGTVDQLPAFLSLNWDHSAEQSAFESALSSLVSSPASNPPPPAAAEGLVIGELIGRLGSVCNSGEISPPSRFDAGGNTSCYSTPLSSPPKLNLAMVDLKQGRGGIPVPGNSVPPANLAPFSADPGFAERAARYSCFGGRNYGVLPGQFGLPEAAGKLSRVSSSHSLKAGGCSQGVLDNAKENSAPEKQLVGRLSGPPTPMEAEFKSAQEASSASGESNPKKRKAVPKCKGKETPLSSPSNKDGSKVVEEDGNAKRCKSAEANEANKDGDVKPKVEQSNGGGGASSDANGGQKQGKETNAKPPEPPKDYIHVRARRGQATDSHSLAERVRREKISERMKLLQDLVPGCNKVTGKAVMLDEIINYVQSLQRQVEFLSMKLATVNPRLEFNMENFLPKDIHQPRGPMPHAVYPLEAATAGFPYAYQPQEGTALHNGVAANALEAQCAVNPLDNTSRHTLSMQLPSNVGFVDAASQLGNFWEDELHSVVQMGFGQTQGDAFTSQSFHGSLPATHMKIEL